MKSPATAAFILSLIVHSADAAVTLTAVRTYDSGTNANAVESSATTLTVAAFTGNVAAAFDAGTGGVVTFDGLSGANSGTWNISYGSGKTLSVTASSTLMRVEMNATITATIAATPISGDGYYRLTGFSPNTLTFADNPLSEFGFTILARNNARSLDSITVTYTDLTTATVIGSTALAANTATGISNYINSPDSGPDVFFGFQAPEGKAILSISIDPGSLNDGNLVIDDFGFIVSPIPEASSPALLLSALTLAALRRRR